MEFKKRSRSVNWDKEEKQLLRDVLQEFSNVIEDKGLTNKTIHLKNEAWNEICEIFNSLNNRHRDVKQIKIQWKTMKVERNRLNKETSIRIRLPSPSSPSPAESISVDETELTQIKRNKTWAQPLPSLQDFSDSEADLELDTDSTPMHEDTSHIETKNKPTCQLNNKQESTKSRKDQHQDLIDGIAAHSKDLKEQVFKLHIEMAEEEHGIKMKMYKEALKHAREEHAVKMRLHKQNIKLLNRKYMLLQNRHGRSSVFRRQI